MKLRPLDEHAFKNSKRKWYDHVEMQDNMEQETLVLSVLMPTVLLHVNMSHSYFIVQQ